MSELPPRPEGRASGRVLTLLGGVAGAAAGLVALGTLVSTALDGSGTSSPTLGLLVSLGLLVVAVVVAALGARRLGVRSVVARAAFAGLVAASGFMALWVVAIVAGRLSS
jgi:cytochrome b561